MISVLRNFPSLLRSRGSSGDQPGNSDARSDDESSSSDSEYGDCQSDEEPKEFVPQNPVQTPKAQAKAQAAPTSVCQPLSSIVIDVVLPTESEDGSFVDVDPEDSFVQTNIPLKAAHSKVTGDVLPTESKNDYIVDLGPDDSFVHTSIPLEPADLRKTPSSWRGTDAMPKIDYVVGLGPEDNFVQTSIPVESADLRRESNSTKGSAVNYKNVLQTWYQRIQAKAGIKVMKHPSYSNVKEGPDHAPIFRASVKVYGKLFESEGFFNSKVEAEKNAASVALSILCPKEFPRDQPEEKRRFTVGSSQFDTSDALACASATTIPVTNVKQERIELAGLTIDAPIDLTEEEESVGSSYPFSTASSPTLSTRSKNASSSYQQCWGGFNRPGTPSGGISTSSLQTKKPISSNSGVSIAGLESSQGIAEQFSLLKLTNTSPCTGFVKHASEPQSVKWPPQTEQLKALGMLEFSTHAFPLMVKLKGQRLEEAVSLDDIESLQNLPADEVNRGLWAIDVHHNRATGPPPPPGGQVDPELCLYDCVIHPEGKLQFRVTENRQGSTLILRVFLKGDIQFSTFKKYFMDGIFVGHRFYQYYVHKLADKDELTDEEKKNDEGKLRCYFVCTDSRGDRDMKDKNFKRFNSIAQARYMIAHVHNCSTVATSNTRMQLCLSKSITIEDISLSDVCLEELPDLKCKDTANSKATFTDRTGFISTDLARLMPTSVYKGKEEGQGKDFCENCPSLIQVRFFHNGAAHKGTLLANTKLGPKTIQYYKSMKKVESDASISVPSISSFELVSSSPSRPPRCAKLSQDLILLLSMGRVQESVFLDAVKHASEDLRLILRDRKRAYDELQSWKSEIDLVDTLLPMLRAGIPMEEPHIQDSLLKLIKLMNKFDDFKKGKVLLDDSYYLMGTADPTGTLKQKEVVILRSDVSIVGEVLVYRAPGKHPGDPHKVQAVKCQALEDLVGGGKNVIFFSTQGTRPLVHEIANGDFDGDMYWICHNRKVVEMFKEWPVRWTPGPVDSEPGKGQKKIAEISPPMLHEALVDEYFNERFNKIQVVGAASVRWKKHVDGFLNPITSPKDRDIHFKEFLKYPDYIYEGVDPKSGVQLTLPLEHAILKSYDPPYLWNRPPLRVLRGKTILGQIYDYGQLTSEEIMQGLRSDSDYYQVGPAFQFQGSEQHIISWSKKYNTYHMEMARALDTRNTEAYDKEEPSRIYTSYKMDLYGGPSFQGKTKPLQLVLEEASAIYQVVYQKTVHDIPLKKQPRVSFVWKVAAEALAFIYAEKGDPMMWSQAAYEYIHKRSRATVSASRQILS